MKKRPLLTTRPCPCGSGQPYSACCRPWHKGQAAETAEQLMRSRYAAYALTLPDYLIATTHPDSPHWETDQATWRRGLQQFSRETKFVGLTILQATETGDTATVTFSAALTQNGRDASIFEQSLFERVNGRWLYVKAMNNEH